MLHIDYPGNRTGSSELPMWRQSSGQAVAGLAQFELPGAFGLSNNHSRMQLAAGSEQAAW
jgi:hypothetical protein